MADVDIANFNASNNRLNELDKIELDTNCSIDITNTSLWLPGTLFVDSSQYFAKNEFSQLERQMYRYLDSNLNMYFI